MEAMAGVSAGCRGRSEPGVIVACSSETKIKEFLCAPEELQMLVRYGEGRKKV